MAKNEILRITYFVFNGIFHFEPRENITFTKFELSKISFKKIVTFLQACCRYFINEIPEITGDYRNLATCNVVIAPMITACSINATLTALSDTYI